MKKQLLLFAVIFFAFGLNMAYGQWNVYKADVLPAEMPDSMWVKWDVTEGVNDGDIIVETSIIDDPDISGNKILKIEDLTGEVKESWAAHWNVDPAVGLTVVFRAKPSDGFVDLAIADAGASGEPFRYAYVSPRNGSNNENLRWQYPESLELNKSGDPIVFPAVDWQIFRITLVGDATALYVNEDPVAVISGNSSKTTDDQFLKIGDHETAGRSGSLYDWIVWDLTGAYAPGTGTPLPSELTGLPGGGSSSVIDFKQGANNLNIFPNPFSSATQISYKVETTSMTRVDVYELTGKMVRTLTNKVQTPGVYELSFNAEDLPGGMYYCKMRSGESVSVVKMLLK